MSKYSVNPTFEFSDEDMIDIISSATYDISYWGGVHDTNEYYEARDELNKSATYEDILYHMLKKGHKILMYDIENELETWDLTLERLLNGIRMTIENGYWSGNMDDIDGEVGDIIFQYALFDGIVYG